jgi:hypothetical protein
MKIHRLTVSSIRTEEKQVPIIRLSGNWLTGFGFKIGCKVIVYEQPDSLLLTLLPENEEV